MSDHSSHDSGSSSSVGDTGASHHASTDSFAASQPSVEAPAHHASHDSHHTSHHATNHAADPASSHGQVDTQSAQAQQSDTNADSDDGVDVTVAAIVDHFGGTSSNSDSSDSSEFVEWRPKPNFVVKLAAIIFLVIFVTAILWITLVGLFVFSKVFVFLAH